MLAYLCVVDLNSREEIALLYNKLVLLPEDLTEPENQEAEEATEEHSVIDEKSSTTPFALVLGSASSQEHLAPKSNLRKILKSNNLSLLLDYVVLSSKFDVSHTYTCIWCIALENEMFQTIKELNHSNILVSPNIEKLTTKEEKMNMYNPFKSFIDQNRELFSHL